MKYTQLFLHNSFWAKASQGRFYCVQLRKVGVGFAACLFVSVSSWAQSLDETADVGQVGNMAVQSAEATPSDSSDGNMQPVIDIVNIAQGAAQRDFRTIYKKAIIKEALDHTKDEYGPYELNSDGPTMSNKRALKELSTAGSLINAYIAVTSEEWEKHTHVIRIPVRRGLLSYRLLLIHKDNKPLFAQVKTIEDLKKLRAGSQTHWVTTSVLKSAGFTVVQGGDYEGLFKMLSSNRFDFLPRGVNEVYGELQQPHLDVKNIIVEPTLALLIPAPVYVFVSPRSPRLIERLEKGLELMVQDGSLKRLFYQFHIDNVLEAELSKRTILEIKNPLLPDETPLDRQELWYSIGEDIPEGIKQIDIPPEY